MFAFVVSDDCVNIKCAYDGCNAKCFYPEYRHRNKYKMGEKQ